MAERDAEGVLARWSRRKAAARGGTPEPEAMPAGEERRDQDAGQPERAAAANPAVARDPVPDLPDPDTLNASSDFKVFMQQGVPPDLRRRALRRLWRLDPAYSHHDGLDDCCGDFTDHARVVKGLRTAYRVGRGFLQELETPDHAAPPATAEPAREPSAGLTAAAAPLADHGTAGHDGQGAPSAAVESTPGGGGGADPAPIPTARAPAGGAANSRERERARPRPLPRHR